MLTQSKAEQPMPGEFTVVVGRFATTFVYELPPTNEQQRARLIRPQHQQAWCNSAPPFLADCSMTCRRRQRPVVVPAGAPVLIQHVAIANILAIGRRITC